VRERGRKRREYRRGEGERKTKEKRTSEMKTRRKGEREREILCRGAETGSRGPVAILP